MRETAASERIEAMDFLRGVALLGIYVVNVSVFAMPSSRAFGIHPGDPLADQVVAAGIAGLFVTKFFALFSMLFGMGLVLQMQRAEAAGKPFASLYLRRLGVLALMGLAHGVFLFMGDILLVYAVAGLLLFLLRCRTPRALLAIAGVFLAIGVALSVVVASIEEPDGVAAVPTWTSDENVMLEDLARSLESAAAFDALERKAFGEGPLASTVLVNAFEFAAWLLASSIVSFNWKVMTYFLVGAALMKWGIFRPERAAWSRRLVRIGLPLGLAGSAWTAWSLYRAGGGALADPFDVLVDEVGSTLLAFGYLGSVLVLASSGALPRLRHAVACAGRMALTHYLLQSVVSNVLFRWWGLDLYEELSRVELLGVALLVFTGQVLFSRAWLARFRMGPLEAAWRGLTYR